LAVGPALAARSVPIGNLVGVSLMACRCFHTGKSWWVGRQHGGRRDISTSSPTCSQRVIRRRRGSAPSSNPPNVVDNKNPINPATNTVRISTPTPVLAIAWLAKSVPPSEHDAHEVQIAAHCVTDAAENDGPMVFARIPMLKATNRDKPRHFTPRASPIIG